MKNIPLILCIYFVPFFAIDSEAQTITTVAGGGCCDGGMATDAVLNRIEGMGMDPMGNLYLADAGDNRIRKVSTTGIITTFLGNGKSRASPSIGVPDFSDGASIHDPIVTTEEPTAIVFQTDGSIILGEEERVRKINTAGIITKIAGMSECFSYLDNGIAFDSRVSGYVVAVDDTGSIFVTNPFNSLIYRITTSGIIRIFDTCEAHPQSIAIDHTGRIHYTAGNNVWRIETPGHHTVVAGSYIHGFSGDGGPANSALLSGPGSISFDGAGNLYISDYGNARIRLVNSMGIITTIAGTGVMGFSGDGGPATDADLNPKVLLADGSGSLYIAGGDHVRKIDASGSISTIAGRAGRVYCGDAPTIAANVQLCQPSDVLADGHGGFFIADPTRHIVHHVDSSGNIRPFAGTGQMGYTGDDGPATAATFTTPTGLCNDLHGNIYISDRDAHVVRRIDPLGGISTVAGTGAEGFPYPGDGRAAVATPLLYPMDIAVDRFGNLFVHLQAYGKVLKVNSAGIITTFAGTGVWVPWAATEGMPATACYLPGLTDLTVDDTGNVYLATNHVVMKVDTTGIVHDITGGYAPDGNTCADGTGPLTSAGGVYYSRIAINKSGSIYFGTYSVGTAIKKRDQLGVIRRIAGKCEFTGWAGDGGPAKEADIATVRAMSLDNHGLYYVDPLNKCIRYITFENAAPVDTFPPTTSVIGNSNHVVSVHPNPFTDFISVNNGSLTGSAALFDVQGQRISQFWTLVPGKQQSLQVPAEIAPGIYFFVVFDEKGGAADVVTLTRK